MIILKTRKELDVMREAGRVLAGVLTRLRDMAATDVTTGELDAEADRMISGAGGVATFRGQGGLVAHAPSYPAATCISINEQVIHGIPSDRVIRDGDLLSIDCGVTLKNLIADSAVSFVVGDPPPGTVDLMDTTRQSLEDGIAAAVPGARLGDVSFAVQSRIMTTDFGIVREFCGHGVGRNLHEDPPIPNYGRPGTGPELRPGMTLAIEPMVTLGSPAVKVLDDGWTVVTSDGRQAAHFEHTIAITDGPAEVLTRRVDEV